MGADGSNSRKPLSEQQIDRIIERACVEAGARRGTAHEFRKSCITNALMRGEKLEVVSRGIANHANPATTIRHYRCVVFESGSQFTASANAMPRFAWFSSKRGLASDGEGRPTDPGVTPDGPRGEGVSA